MAKRLLIACWALALSLAPPAAAQDDTAKQAARQLGQEGIDLFEKGDFEAASDRLERAYAVVRVPTLGLWLARSLAKQGRLVEALERYNDVGRMTLGDDAPKPFKAAKDKARNEQAELEPRIPSLVIVIDGASAGDVTVDVDGKAIAPALVGVPVPVNPGERVVRGQRNDVSVEKKVTLAERDTTTVTLRFHSAPTEAAPPPVAPAPTASSPKEAPEDPGVEAPGSSQPTMAFIAFGVGGAGLIVGGIYAAIAQGKRSDLDDSGLCIETRCSPSIEDDVDSHNTANTISRVGLAVGGVGVLAGAVLLMTAPSRPESPRSARRVEPWVGFKSAGVKGAF